MRISLITAPESLSTGLLLLNFFFLRPLHLLDFLPAVLNDGHLAIFRQLGQTIQHEQLLTIGNLGQTRRKTAIFTQLGFGFDGLLFALPVDAEGRVC